MIPNAFLLQSPRPNAIFPANTRYFPANPLQNAYFPRNPGVFRGFPTNRAIVSPQKPVISHQRALSGQISWISPQKPSNFQVSVEKPANFQHCKGISIDFGWKVKSMTAEERQKLDFYREKAAKTQGNREKLAKYEKFARNTAEKTRSSKTNAGKVAKISEKSDICVKTPVKVKNSQEIYSKRPENTGNHVEMQENLKEKCELNVSELEIDVRNFLEKSQKNEEEAIIIPENVKLEELVSEILGEFGEFRAEIKENSAKTEEIPSKNTTQSAKAMEIPRKTEEIPWKPEEISTKTQAQAEIPTKSQAEEKPPSEFLTKSQGNPPNPEDSLENNAKVKQSPPKFAKLGKYATIALNLERFFSGTGDFQEKPVETASATLHPSESFVLFDRISYKKRPKTQKTVFF